MPLLVLRKGYVKHEHRGFDMPCMHKVLGSIPFIEMLGVGAPYLE